MKSTETRRDCPAMPSLAAWFEGTLNSDAADRIEQHLSVCDLCRRSLLEWSERLGGTASAGVGSDDCPDAEALVAYCATTLDVTAAAEIEGHLQGCVPCVRSVQHIAVLQRQMETERMLEASSLAAPSTVRVLFGRRGLGGMAERRLKSAATASRRLLVRRLLVPSASPRTALAAAAVLVLAIGVTRFVLPSAQVQQMHVRDAGRASIVEVTVDTAGRARPATDEPVVLQVARGTHATWLETSGEWTRVELVDGRRVWVESRALAEFHEQ